MGAGTGELLVQCSAVRNTASAVPAAPSASLSARHLRASVSDVRHFRGRRMAKPIRDADDELHWREARAEMVRSQIASRGVRDPRVLDVMARLPRHRFVPAPFRAEAYSDKALPLDNGQTISQPYMVAHMTEWLEVQPGDKVLEVGTGSGYQSVVLALLGAQVHTVDRLAAMAESAERLLADLGIDDVTVHWGDGSLGWPSEAPFDRILVTAGAPAIPPALVQQLAVGGRLVAPVGGPAGQIVVAADRLAGRFVETPGLACRFVKLLGQQGWPDDAGPAA